MNTTPPFDLVIGLDRSVRKADLHQIDLSTGAEHRQTLPTSPEALQAWAQALHAAHPNPNARVTLCFEQPANAQRSHAGPQTSGRHEGDLPALADAAGWMLSAPYENPSPGESE